MPTDTPKGGYRAVVKYAVSATPGEKRHALKEGLRECARELLEMGEAQREIIADLEQLGSDVETDPENV